MLLEPLTPSHDASDFQNQHEDLVQWLRHRALQNEQARASRTLVSISEQRVVGYYALAAGAIECSATPCSVRRNMPAPIPAVVLARLAVDERHQGRGLGSTLLSHALRRSLYAGSLIGARVLLCHAADASARQFYLRQGFVASPTHALTLMLDLKQAAALA